MGTGKKKIEIKLLEKGEQRMVTFSKRRQGLFKKAHELHCLTGAHIASVVFYPARGGRPYVHGGPSFDATIDRYLNMSNTNSSGASATGYSSTSSSSSRVEEMINGGDDSDGGTGGANGKMMMMLRCCLEGMRVEDYWDLKELVLIKEKMEVIKGKVVQQIEDEFVMSCLSSI